jgi:hypothetical protein
MKMVKSLLLGATAGIVVMSGAQAADLPVKAKPVQYVKICSLYGAGFFYIPGTDTCIKIGGYARNEWSWNANGSFNPQLGINYSRTQNELVSRSRILLSTDIRSQTDYGTLRGFGRFALQWSTGDAATGGSVNNNAVASGGIYVDRAFLQLGGWTFGKTESYVQFNLADFGYSNQTQVLFGDSTGNGQPVLAYTYQFGNGLSASLAIEDHMDNWLGADAGVSAGASITSAVVSITATGNTGSALTNTGTVGTGGQDFPDIVANLRVDQAWGSAQIAGDLVQNQPAYYSGGITHPSNVWGGIVEGGILVNLPQLAKGDTVGISGTYCDGASHGCGNNSSTYSTSSNQLSGTLGTQVPGNPAMFNLTEGNTTGFGQLWDGFYANPGGSLQLSHTWNVNGGIQHYWTPMLRTSLWGTYLNFNANSSAVDAACAATPVAAGGFQAAGCMNWSAYQVGSRTMWNPVPNMDVSLEVMYSRVHSALAGTTSVAAGTGTSAATYGDQGVWSGVLRFQRNFWP